MFGKIVACYDTLSSANMMNNGKSCWKWLQFKALPFQWTVETMNNKQLCCSSKLKNIKCTWNSISSFQYFYVHTTLFIQTGWLQQYEIWNYSIDNLLKTRLQTVYLVEFKACLKSNTLYDTITSDIYLSKFLYFVLTNFYSI